MKSKRKNKLGQLKAVITLLLILFAAIILTIRFVSKQANKPQIPEIAVQEQGFINLGLIGRANLLLSAPNTNVEVGDYIQVDASIQLTDDRLQVSGVDFVILYDKNKLEVVNLVPNIMRVYPRAPFDTAPIVTYGGNFDKTYDFLRVAEVASRSGTLLAGGTLNLAKITFRAKEAGGGVIKYPDDNKYFEIAGTGTYISPTPLPTGLPTATKTPTLIPTRIPTPPTATWTPTPKRTPTPAATPVATPTPPEIPDISFIIDEYKKIILAKLVSAVERYYISYNHFPPESDPNDILNDWIETLVDSGEFSRIFYYFMPSGFKPVNCNTQSQKGFCYWSDGKDKAVIFVKMDYKPTKAKCKTGIANFLWCHADNRIGVVCMTEDSYQLSGFTYL